MARSVQHPHLSRTYQEQLESLARRQRFFRFFKIGVVVLIALVVGAVRVFHL